MQYVIPAIFCVSQARGDREADVKREVADTLCSMSASSSPEKRGEKKYRLPVGRLSALIFADRLEARAIKQAENLLSPICP